jgi:hypothetical protein
MKPAYRNWSFLFLLLLVSSCGVNGASLTPTTPAMTTTNIAEVAGDTATPRLIPTSRISTEDNSAGEVVKATPTSQAQPTPTGAINAVATMPLRVEKDNRATFVDPLLGIQIDFPSDWRFIMRPDDVGYRMSHFYSPCKSQAPEVLPPCSKIQIFWEDEAYANLEELEAYFAGTEPYYPLISRQIDEKVIDGTPVLWIQSENKVDGITKQTLLVCILREKGTILISGYGNLEPVVKIMGTIKLLEIP